MDNKAQEFARKVIGELEKIRQGMHDLLDAPRKYEKESIGHQQHSPKDNKPRDREVVPVTQADPSPLQSKTSEYKWYQSIPWWRLLEGLGIAAGIGYAVVTYLQWCDVKK